MDYGIYKFLVWLTAVESSQFFFDIPSTCTRLTVEVTNDPFKTLLEFWMSVCTATYVIVKSIP